MPDPRPATPDPHDPISARAFALAPDAMAITTFQDGRFVDVNDAFCAMLGRERDAFLGHTADELELFAEPWKREELVEALRSGGSTGPVDVLFRTSSGEARKASYTSVLIDGAEPSILSIARDVTDREQIERVLRESEERYRRVSEMITDFSYSLRITSATSFELEWITPSVTRNLGYEVGEIDPADWMSFVHPDDLETSIAGLQEAIGRGGGAYVTNVRLIRKDGEARWFRFTNHAEVDAETGDVRLFGAASDVTDERRSAQEKEAAESRYRSLVEQIPAVTYIEEADPSKPTEERHELYVSPQIEEMVGYPPDGWSIQRWLESIHPDDREWVQARNEESGRTGEPFIAEYRVLSRDRRTIWVHEEARLLHGDPSANDIWQGIAFDITERKLAERALLESESKFRTLVEQIPAITYIEEWLDPDGPRDGNPLLYVSPQIEDIWGIPPEARLGDPHLWREALHPDDVERVVEADERSSRDGTPLIEDYRLVRGDGEVVWIHEDTRLVRTADDAPLYWLGVMFDVTGEKRHAEELERSLAELRRSDEQRRALLGQLVGAQEEERQRIAADIHDDSIQRMAAINLRLETLRRQTQGDEALETLTQIEAGVQETMRRLRHLMFELWPPGLERHGLAATVKAELEETRKTAGLAFELSDHLEVEPVAEIRTIAYRIIQEAITNIRKHADATTVSVALETSRDGTRDGVRARVRDDGKGFADAGAESPPGHLGLSAMRERAALAGGWLDVISRPDGTTIDFWLPNAAPGSDDDPRTVPEPS